jgi:D-alanine-D-alanine ligase-like ATP-grasp enzyme/L-alanine-DL-glutamate epimerase-like enolase superfamily enzyme/acylphosphatase
VEGLELVGVRLLRFSAVGRSANRAPANLLVHLRAQIGGTTLDAYGEGVFRRTDGGTHARVWPALGRIADALPGAVLDASDTVTALSEVTTCVRRAALDDGGRDRFPPGLALAFEAATLDLLGRVQGVPSADLLAARRVSVGLSARPVAAGTSTRALATKVDAQLESYPTTCLVGRGDVADDLAALAAAGAAGAAAGVPERPIWLDLNGRLSVAQGIELVERVAHAMTAGALPPDVTIEQPLAADEVEALRQLQVRADGLLAGAGDLRIMADQSVTSMGALERLVGAGGCRAINLRLHHAGGPLTALRMAEAAHAADPDVHVAVGPVPGGTELSEHLTLLLARCVPRLDAFVLEHRAREAVVFARPMLERRPPRPIVPSVRNGVGATPNLGRVISHTDRHITRPARRSAPVVTGIGGEAANVYDLPHLARFGKNSLDNHFIERECLALGFSTVRTTSVTFLAKPPQGEPFGFHCNGSTATSKFGGKTTSNKQAARIMMSRAGVPVTEGRSFHPGDLATARDYAATLGWPVVVKPLGGKGGVGVAVNLRSDAHLEAAVAAVERLRASAFIVERHAWGNDYRALVAGGRVASIVRRDPACVVGDGSSSIEDLVLEKNELRRANPHMRTRLITIDRESRDLLVEQGLTLSSVPEPGRRVLLSRLGNLSRGGESYEVSPETHPTVARIAIDAVAVFPGLLHAGVDLLVEDHTRPADEQSAIVCEVNPMPGIAPHHFPLFGQPRNAARELVLAHCDLYGIEVPSRVEQLQLRQVISGLVDGVGYEDWMASRARELGVRCEVHPTADGAAMEAQLEGPTDPVAALAALASVGPRPARVELVETEHTSG